MSEQHEMIGKGPAIQTLMTGLVFGESARWHDGRFWFSDWGTHEIIALDPGSRSEVVVRLPGQVVSVEVAVPGN
jgi:sugar lactone lactonase YvrE